MNRGDVLEKNENLWFSEHLTSDTSDVKRAEFLVSVFTRRIALYKDPSYKRFKVLLHSCSISDIPTVTFPGLSRCLRKQIISPFSTSTQSDVVLRSSLSDNKRCTKIFLSTIYVSRYTTESFILRPLLKILI